MISEKIKSDTVNKRSALLLSGCYEANSQLRNLIINKEFFTKAFTESKTRIENLKHDLKESSIEQNKALEYVVHELNASGKVTDPAMGMHKEMTGAILKLDSLKEQLTALADSLQSK